MIEECDWDGERKLMKKKAVIIGGSNGIGLSIAKNFISRDFDLVILDIVKPDFSFLSEKSVVYYPCNLMDLDDSLIYRCCKDSSIEALVITAGIGRVADFEYLHPAEIKKVLTIDLVATIKIVHMFYERIKSRTPFYTAIMGSIAGLVSSPMFSVYAAAKAGICRFTESINIEIEEAGFSNRILNVSPGSIKGTSFNGGQNDLLQTSTLANNIVEKMLQRQTLYIPEYEEIYKDVLAKYQANPHEYGLYSYKYKLTSGRAKNIRKVKIGYLSGTFDLFHVGHLNLLRRAKMQCDYLIVGVHSSGEWKGKKTFIPFEERKEIVGSCKYVDKVVDSCCEDSDAWNVWHYDVLFVGSDYKGTERFNRYEKYFRNKGVDIVYFPYTESRNSTQLRTIIEARMRGL